MCSNGMMAPCTEVAVGTSGTRQHAGKQASRHAGIAAIQARSQRECNAMRVRGYPKANQSHRQAVFEAVELGRSSRSHGMWRGATAGGQPTAADLG